MVFLHVAIPASAFENWISLRDAGVVRQERDFSCGVAALATILTYYYRQPVTEETLLKELARVAGPSAHAPAGRSGVSFADLQELAESRGFAALGISLSYRDLDKLRQPVIVALDVEGQAHFTVLRHMNPSTGASIADPSWGNLRLSPQTFVRMFGATPGGERGRVLIIGSGLAGSDRVDDYRLRQRPLRMLPAGLRPFT